MKLSFLIAALLTAAPGFFLFRNYAATPEDPQKGVGYVIIALFLAFLWLMASMTLEGLRRLAVGDANGRKVFLGFGGIGLMAALAILWNVVQRERLSNALKHSTDAQYLQQQALKALEKDDLPALTLIAGNPSTPADTLRELSRTKDVWVLAKTAQNPTTPQATLKELSQHQRYLVKVGVLNNPRVGMKIIEEMKADHDSRIRDLASAKARETPQR